MDNTKVTTPGSRTETTAPGPASRPDTGTGRFVPALDVHGLLTAAAAIDPEATAFIDATSGAETPYRALIAHVQALAGMVHAAAPDPDTRPRIGIALPNGAALATTLLASAIAGAATPFNPGLTLAEFERYFRATRIDMLILSERDNGPASSAASALGLPVLRLTSGLRLAGVAPARLVPQPVPEDIALVLMTSGSTGLPKIVPLSHGNVCASARDVVRSIGLSAQDRCLVMWQQFHIGGLVDLLLAPLSAGGALILTEGFSAARFFDLRARHAPTWFQGVPTTLGELLAHADRHDMPAGPGSLRLIRSVAAALSPALQDRLEARFDVPVVRTLGMTEAGPLITSTALPPVADKRGSVGRPCGPELCILDDAGRPLAPGAIGMIAIRGENVFAGYENNPDANAEAFRDGWFLTGDRGHVDADGDLFLTGRATDQINRGGYKIMPSEVEDVLSRHPDVREAAVFGRPHATLGTDVAAAVTLVPGAAADAAALRAYLAPHLAAHKIPSTILVEPALPRNPVGKIDRMALALAVAAREDDQGLLQPPRTDLERCLAGIWARELELSEIGVRQDFTMLGGDSLSALRVIVAMEEALEAPMPDAVVENLTTVEEVARLLDAAGLAAPVAPDRPPASPPTEIERNEKLSEIDAADVLAVLGRVAGRSELDLAIRQMVLYRTPAQVDAVLRAVPLRAVAQDGGSLMVRLRLRHRFLRKRREILAEIRAGGPGPSAWQRRIVTQAATLYFAQGTPVGQRTLIVGFSGNGQGMSAEMYRFLRPLDPARFDFLLLRDTARRNLYIDGLPDMAADLSRLAAWLGDFADTEGYGRRIALGTSGGGLAAIHTGLDQGWDGVVAMCPPRLSKHQRYAPLIADLGRRLSEGGGPRCPVLVSNGTYANDIDATRQLMAHLPFIAQDFHAECSEHNLLDFARKTGRSDALYARWFGAVAATGQTVRTDVRPETTAST